MFVTLSIPTLLHLNITIFGNLILVHMDDYDMWVERGREVLWAILSPFQRIPKLCYYFNTLEKAAAINSDTSASTSRKIP